MANSHLTNAKNAKNDEFYTQFIDIQKVKICAVCGYPAVELHHLVYANFGSERDKDLVPLCRLHHQGLHDFAGVRQNSSYQSRYFIESEKKKYKEEKREMVIDVNRARSESRVASGIHSIASSIRRLLRIGT